MFYHLLDEIWLQFLFWIKLVILVHLKINKFSLFQDLNLIGTDSLSLYDNLYLLDTIFSFNETLRASSRDTK